mgnify:CR=1 FL=1
MSDRFLRNRRRQVNLAIQSVKVGNNMATHTPTNKANDCVIFMVSGVSYTKLMLYIVEELSAARTYTKADPYFVVLIFTGSYILFAC